MEAAQPGHASHGQRPPRTVVPLMREDWTRAAAASPFVAAVTLRCWAAQRGRRTAALVPVAPEV